MAIKTVGVFEERTSTVNFKVGIRTLAYLIIIACLQFGVLYDFVLKTITLNLNDHSIIHNLKFISSIFYAISIVATLVGWYVVEKMEIRYWDVSLRNATAIQFCVLGVFSTSTLMSWFLLDMTSNIVMFAGVVLFVLPFTYRLLRR
jgi:predicted membrane-bound spermidine synthase